MDRVSPEEINRRFTFHAPPDQQVVRAHDGVRIACLNSAVAILDETPECREQSLAITKLEEAMFWANAAVARNHEHYEPTEAPVDPGLD